MTELNGKVGRRKVVEFETNSGVIVWVNPLSNFFFVRLQELATDQFPYPDPTPYETPAPNAAIEGTVIPAKENAEYRELCRQMDIERRKWLVGQALDLALEFPEGKNALLDRFENQITAMKAIDKALADIQPWRFFRDYVLMNADERNRMLDAALDALPVSGGEVLEQVRLFRPQVSGREN